MQYNRYMIWEEIEKSKDVFRVWVQTLLAYSSGIGVVY